MDGGGPSRTAPAHGPHQTTVSPGPPSRLTSPWPHLCEVDDQAPCEITTVSRAGRVTLWPCHAPPRRLCEVVRQVYVHCAERGELLLRLRKCHHTAVRRKKR